MKFSVGTVLAFAAAALAKPVLLNSNYQITEGEPFTLKWNNAQGPVTITLMTGDPNHLNKVTDLTSKPAPRPPPSTTHERHADQPSRPNRHRVHLHPQRPALGQVRHPDLGFVVGAQLQRPVRLRRHRRPPQQQQHLALSHPQQHQRLGLEHLGQQLQLQLQQQRQLEHHEQRLERQLQ